MTELTQGRITKLTQSGTQNVKANITDEVGMVTINAVVPERLRESGKLTIGTAVIFATFDDNSSVIFSRCDGAYS